jgi:hypothetical protein
MKNKVIDKALALAAKRGLNQTQFGEALDVAPANVTNWKARDLPANLYVKVASLLGISINELLSHDDEQVPRQESTPWPFTTFTAAQINQLGKAQLSHIERIVATFLVPQASVPDWRSAAIKVAADIDQLAHTETMTFFIQKVEQQYREECLKLEQLPKSKRPKNEVR